MDEYEKLVESLVFEGWLKTPAIIRAFLKIKREDFLPEELKKYAHFDEPLPIGFGQTISQPLVVAFMLELLEPKKGEKILDIGSGSGWTSSLLAEIVGEKGKVFALEVIPELKEFGEKNSKKYNFVQKGILEFFVGDGYEGLKEKAPFDKILCSAALQKEVPNSWKEQLKINGKIVTPIGTSLWLFEKETKNSLIGEEFPGFVFVPLIRKK